MKRDNRVFLTGTVKLEKIGTIDQGGAPGLVACCQVQTDHSALGGCHPVQAYNQLAAEVMAFSLASKVHHETLEGLMDGWLVSHAGKSVTVVDRLTFRVGSQTRETAVVLMNQILRGETQEQFQVGGRTYSVKDLLGAAFDDLGSIEFFQF
jgi:hypothetical protein